MMMVMRRKIVLVCLCVLLIQVARSQDCVRKVSESKLNISFCIDSLMGVNMHPSLKVKLYSKDGNAETREVSVKAVYNTDDKSEKELWEDAFLKEKVQGAELKNFVDSQFVSKGTTYYMAVKEFEHINGQKWIVSSAVAKYKTQYY